MRTTPVLTPCGMRAWERATWSAGVREADVIARVGEAVAAAVRRMAPTGRVLLLAGKGHNGDDARAAMAHLAGREVALLDVHDPVASLPGLVRELSMQPSLVVDGLFGIGLNRHLSDEWIRLVELVNAASRRVLAVDVPSGLNASWDVPLAVAGEPIRVTAPLVASIAVSDAVPAAKSPA